MSKGRPAKTNENTEISVFSQSETAKLLGVSLGSVQNASAVKRADSKLHEKVKSGEMKAGAARAELKRRRDAMDAKKNPDYPPDSSGDDDPVRS